MKLPSLSSLLCCISVAGSTLISVLGKTVAMTPSLQLGVVSYILVGLFAGYNSGIGLLRKRGRSKA